MSEDQKLTSCNIQEDEANLGHENLAQEIGDVNSVAEHNGKESPVPELKQEEIEGDILENEDEQNSEKWWNYVQTLVKNEENDNYGNLPARYCTSLCFSLEPCIEGG